MDDLFQVGCIGLIKAIDNFDLSQQVMFSTYACPMIIGEIRRYLRDNNSIRVSRSLRDTAYKAIYAKEAYIKKNNKEPTIMEIAGEIGISKEDIVFAMDAIQSPVSLYEPVYTEGGDTLCIMDQVSDRKNDEECWVESIALREAMKRLSHRESSIINMRFFEGQDSDGGGPGTGNLPGSDFEDRKKCPQVYEKLSEPGKIDTKVCQSYKEHSMSKESEPPKRSRALPTVKSMRPFPSWSMAQISSMVWMPPA